jgi:hypothetical protein
MRCGAGRREGDEEGVGFLSDHERGALLVGEISFEGCRMCNQSPTPWAGHVHVESGDGYAKFWLEPVSPVAWVGFGPRDLRRIRRILILHKSDILEQWHEHRARQDQ